ncbi:MAG: PAC2 family protein, partial [Actinomyces sp.]
MHHETGHEPVDPLGTASDVVWSTEPPRLRRPVLVAAFEGWNDAGDAATIAARHLIDRAEAVTIAEIDAEHYHDFSVTRPLMRLVDGERSIVWPVTRILAGRLDDTDRDLVVVTGIEPQLRWKRFCRQVLSVAEALGVARVITLGALLADVPHSRPVDVSGTTDDDELRAELDLTPSTYEGPTGIVGVLTAACRDAGLPTASFWAAVPGYVPGAPSPKAALALLERVARAIGTRVSAPDLEIASGVYERQIDELVAEDDDT